MRNAKVLRKARHGEVDQAASGASDELLGDQLFTHDGSAADATGKLRRPLAGTRRIRLVLRFINLYRRLLTTADRSQ
jgi:hypothetical protein